MVLYKARDDEIIQVLHHFFILLAPRGLLLSFRISISRLITTTELLIIKWVFYIWLLLFLLTIMIAIAHGGLHQIPSRFGVIFLYSINIILCNFI